MGICLESINSKNFKDYILSIDRCNNLLKSVQYILDSYKIIRQDPKQGLNLLNNQLDGISKNIQIEKSYKLFCELVVATPPAGNSQDEVIPLFRLIEVMEKNTLPFFPWQSIENNDFLIYDNEIEELYFTNLEGNRDKQVDETNYRFQFGFDKAFITTVNEMKKYPRSREILNLYQNILLAQDFKIKEDIKYLFEEKGKTFFYKFFATKISEAEEKNESLFENMEILTYRKSHEEVSSNIDNDLKEAKELPRSLFLKHFYAALNSLESKSKLNIKLKINEVQLRILQNHLFKFANQLIFLKKGYESTLNEINNFREYETSKEKEFNQLKKDVIAFFKKRDINLFKTEFPTSRALQSIKPGGSGILKRINSYGGLTKFKHNFYLTEESADSQQINTVSSKISSPTTESLKDKKIDPKRLGAVKIFN
tara:strand:+ start:1130 stop:2404 length:1275 start_codon:yes stop_codon:yes gene_type:complete